MALALISCIGADPSPSSTPPGGETGDGAGGTQIGADGAPICTPVPEKCGNKIDDNCDGVIDEGCDCSNVPEGMQRSCGQAGPGICKQGTQICQNSAWTECTGVDPHPTEDTCDGKDENCNGVVDEGLTIVCLHDIDHDGYPNAADKKSVCPDPTAAAAPRFGCPVDYIRDTQSPGNDCNDNDPSIKPGVGEHCDAVDWDCDGKPRNTCPSATETYGVVVSSGIYGITSLTGGCGTQTYATSSTTCPGGASGLGGFWSGPFTAPTQVQLACRDGIIGEAVAVPEYTYKLGWNGPTALSPLTGPGRADDIAGSATCNTGDFVVGIKHTKSCLFDRVTIICAPITYVRNGATWKATPGATYDVYALGNSGSAAPETIFQCAAGSVLSSITEWHTTGSATDSNYISGMKFGCEPLAFTPQ